MNDCDIVKSNYMIHAYLSGELSLVATRLIYACLLQIRSKTDKFDHRRVFVVKGNDLADITGRRSKNGYRALSDAVKSNLEGSGFRTRYNADGSLIFPDSPNSLKYMSIVNSVYYYHGAGEVHITFSPDVIPYISQLKGNFTKLVASSIIPMKSRYGMRLYELALSWLGHDKEFTLDEFRELFGIVGKYKNIKDLKRRVLNPALADIASCTDLNIRFGQVKRGRQVVAFQFSVTRTKPRKLSRGYIEQHAKPGESWEDAKYRLTTTEIQESLVLGD